MEKSTNLSKIWKILLPIFDQLYIFQLTEYKVLDYIRYLPKLLFKRDLQKHDHLHVTNYIKILLLTYLFICILFILFLYINTNIYIAGIFILLTVEILSPIIIVISSILIKPIYILKAEISKHKAKQKVSMQKNNGLKIVGITGSYGKTTTKNILYQLIQSFYKTQTIPGNINTAIGISNWINKHLDSNTQILIVEMGAYKRGEIKESTIICQPDISIITTIAKQHMERFGTFQNIINTKLEIFDFSPEENIKICSKNVKHLLPKRSYKIIFTEPMKYIDVLNFKILKENFHTAYKAAQLLNVPEIIIKSSLKTLTIPDRRGNIINYKDFTLIDNSYNISIDTALEGFQIGLELSNKMKKNLLVITAGIPETGKEKNLSNQQYAKRLNEKAYKVFLLKSSLYKYIYKSLKPEKLTTCNSVKEALSIIDKQYSPKNTIILCQPELNDLYYL